MAWTLISSDLTKSFSASCEAVGQRSGLCALADQAVVQVGWSLAFMDSTAQQVLNLIESQPGSGSGPRN